MATVARPSSNPTVASSVTLFSGQTTTGASTTCDRRSLTGPAHVYCTFTDTGAGQSVTFDIQGSNDDTNWYNVPYSLPATPTTVTVASITFNTASGGTASYLLTTGYPYRYVRLNISAVTNMTTDAVIYCFAP
jgi:hypothetical protein